MHIWCLLLRNGVTKSCAYIMFCQNYVALCTLTLTGLPGQSQLLCYAYTMGLPLLLFCTVSLAHIHGSQQFSCLVDTAQASVVAASSDFTHTHKAL